MVELLAGSTRGGILVADEGLRIAVAALFGPGVEIELSGAHAAGATLAAVDLANLLLDASCGLKDAVWVASVTDSGLCPTFAEELASIAGQSETQ